MKVYILEYHYIDGDNYSCSDDNIAFGIFATRDLAQAECDRVNEPYFAQMEKDNQRAVRERDRQQAERDALVAAGLKEPHTFGPAHQREKPQEYYSVEEHEVIEGPPMGGCPDDGTCHHHCPGQKCFRVVCCGPLSGVYPNDEWPQEVVKAHG